MTSSDTEAIKKKSAFSIHIDLKNHPEGIFPAVFGCNIANDWENYDTKFEATAILETEFDENSNRFASSKNRRNWNRKLVWKITVV